MKPLIYVIVGSTATGKTKLAVEIAKYIDGEVISADSMQIYREMNIGTAKPTENEKQGIRHHMIDVCNPDYCYSVAEFQINARTCINGIIKRNKTPIITGGSGLYINSLTYDLDFSNQKRNEEFRDSLNKIKTADLHSILEKKDKVTADRIHPNNRVRIVRALEIAYNGNCAKYNFNKQNNKYNFNIIGLRFERPTLYERINARVEKMLKKGLEEEVKYLYKKYGDTPTAFQGIGYKEFISHFNKEYDYQTTVEKIKQHTRNLAKRQQTWFKRDERINWFDLHGNEDINTHLVLDSIAIQSR